MVNQPFPIALSPAIRRNGNVLELIDARRLPGDHAFRFYASLIQDEHFSPLKIPVDHVLLLISQ